MIRKGNYSKWQASKPKASKLKASELKASKLKAALMLSALLPCSVLCPAIAESSAPETGAASKSRTESPYRLADTVSPVRYELDFTPEPEKGSFSGSETVELKIKKATTSIVMNANDLLVSTASLISESKKTQALQVKLDKTLQRVSFVAASSIAPGTYHLSCSFSGHLNDHLAGFYRSTFKDRQGKTHYLSATQMEPTDARRMFPCFDEPAFKAVFSIKTRIPKNCVAISNAPVAKEAEDATSGKKIVQFEDSKPMSSYLVALLSGEFKATEVLKSEGVAIRVWSVQPDIALGDYARDNAGKLLKYLNSYFRIPYPWKKLDLIAVPDFEAGAMENPGAITFREKYLLADEKNSALNTRQGIVSIIAHEMAHLWFGDLVTMKWWDDIWLNEAFATWMAKKAVDNVHPEWNVMAEFFSDRMKALFTDSLHSTRSIQSVVVKPEDAMQMFDEITYVKGSSVLRMLEYFLGEGVFQNGISAYLKEHSFNNATTANLWESLAKASSQQVKEIMDTWCKQPGYPLLNVVSVTGGQVKLKQERFLLAAAAGKQDAAQLWEVPLGLRVLKGKPTADANGRVAVKADYTLIKKNEDTAKIAAAAAAAGELICANGGGYGFYRTEYPGDLSSKLADKLNLMTPAERLCFLSDHAALSTAGKIPVGQYLNVLKAYRSETDQAVWNCIISCLRQLDRFVQPESRSDFHKLVGYLLKDEYQKLGWESRADESGPTRLVRAQMIETLGTIGADSDVIARARQIFAKYVKEPKSANPDIIEAVTDVVAYNGDESDFETVKTLWKKADNPELEHRNLAALSGFRNKAVIQKALELTLSKDVRGQDAPRLLASFFDINDAKAEAWKFMKSHWGQIGKQYAPHMLPRLSEAPQTLTDASSYKDVKAFFAANKVPEGASNVARMLEKLQINVRFAEKDGKALNSWLKDNASALK